MYYHILYIERSKITRDRPPGYYERNLSHYTSDKSIITIFHQLKSLSERHNNHLFLCVKTNDAGGSLARLEYMQKGEGLLVSTLEQFFSEGGISSLIESGVIKDYKEKKERAKS